MRLLCADKDDVVVEMTLGDDVENVYASKYLNIYQQRKN